jgi:hypothetical protein
LIPAQKNDLDRNVDGFDIIIAELVASKWVGVDGGSAPAVKSSNRKHWALLMQQGQSFGFAAHELDHCLGLITRLVNRLLA